MKIYALALVLVAALAATAAAAPGAGWGNPAGYGGQYVQPAQTVYAQPAAYRGWYGMRGNVYNGGAYNGEGCSTCGNYGHAGVCWDCSNAWDGYCNEARGSCCAGIWDGFCNERHCDWCGHHRVARGHCGADHCGANCGGCGWKRPLFARSCGPCDDCDTCEGTDACDDCNRGCRRHCRPLAWFGSMCEKSWDNCRKGWDRCNACFAGLRNCFGGCGCDDYDSCGCGIGAASAPVETVLPSTSEREVVPPTPVRDAAPSPGPSA